MKGMKCKCGFATVADKRKCPRCGKTMTAAEWPDEGKVLSFEELQVIPEGFEAPSNLVLVSIEKGPKVICWTADRLKVDDDVTISEKGGRLVCSPRTEQKSELEEKKLKT